MNISIYFNYLFNYLLADDKIETYQRIFLPSITHVRLGRGLKRKIIINKTFRKKKNIYHYRYR
jgi:hypothetical protein